MLNIEHVLPEDIERRSFEIISEELKNRGITLPKETEMVTKRVIHTSADFEYAQTDLVAKCSCHCQRTDTKWGRYCDRYQYGTCRNQQEDFSTPWW